MNKKHHEKNKYTISEKIKWFSIFIYFILMLCLNYYFYNESLFIRTLITSFLIACIIVTATYTHKGKHILRYIKMSQKEMQKIIWPNYRETLYTTFVIIIVTIFISLILWGIDSIIFYLIAFIISLRF